MDAHIEPSGYATILQAPSPAYPEDPPPPDNRPVGGEAAWYARDQNIPETEARKRLADQEALQPEFERLLATLRKQEAGNFTAPRMVHAPDWAYELHFKREPAATLARYTRHPRFRAALAPYTRAELDGLIQPWAARFQKAGILSGYGSDETLGTAEFILTLTRAEYERMAAREGWRLPDAIKLAFAPELQGAVVDPKAVPLVRLFPQSDRAAGIVLASATSGRIVLQDGCFRVLRPNQPPALAYFAKEAGLGLDEQGYLALRERSPKPPSPQSNLGRIGEVFVWGGYGAVTEDMAMVAELRKRCGAGPITHVGNPTSLHHFRVRPFAIDEYARGKRITRQAAWTEIKACWRQQDARAGSGFGADCDSAPAPQNK
ncbi:MAG: hypothetical protein M3R16_07880 [Pseudomonadota bacterium]|nr:hypothetical protein [Pseudomonadota bacterium]